MAERIIGRGFKAILRSLQLMNQHKLFVLLNSFLAAIILVRLMISTRFPMQAFATTCIATSFTGLISIYIHDALRKKTPPIPFSLKKIALHVPAILVLSAFNTLALTYMHIFLDYLAPDLDNIFFYIFYRNTLYAINAIVISILLLENQSLFKAATRSFKFILSNFLALIGWFILLAISLQFIAPLVDKCLLTTRWCIFIIPLIDGILFILNIIFTSTLYYESRSSN